MVKGSPGLEKCVSFIFKRLHEVPRQLFKMCSVQIGIQRKAAQRDRNNRLEATF